MNSICSKIEGLSTDQTAGRVARVKQYVWYFAKALEASAMGIVGYALLIGLQSDDPFTELQWLMAGVVIFMVGLGLERIGGGDS